MNSAKWRSKARTYNEWRWTAERMKTLTERQFRTLTVCLQARDYRSLGIEWKTHVFVKWAPNEDLVIRFR